MESLIINSPYNRAEFVKSNLLRWEIHWLKNRKQIFGFAIASIIILFIGIISITEEEPTNPFVFLGIVFSVSTIFLLYLRIFSKRRFKKKIEEIAERFESLKMDCTYVFSDESIKYWDKEKTIDFKWSLFTYYSFYKEHLVIALNNSLIDSYLFKKEGANIEEFEKILEFVKMKLEYKEIK
jgi:hypothetical protein